MQPLTAGRTGAIDLERIPRRRAVTPELLLALVVPVGLWVAALVIRLWAAQGVPVAPNEGSAYYVGVAANLVAGRGLVSDSIWSYATPPLVLPKPAFELWLPMASFVAAVPMTLLGTGLWSAQVGMALLGAVVAPLTWFVARDAARRNGLDGPRARAVAVGAGSLAAIAAPFLVATMAPDSTTPFLVFGLAACCVIPRALELPSHRLAGFGVGLLLGLAYLSRQEAVYIGVAYLLLLVGAARAVPGGRRLRSVVTAVALPVLGGLAVVVPWLLRNLGTFGSLWPGQAVENAWFTANEQIFAYATRPTANAFLDQGAATIVGNQLRALESNVVDVLLLQAAPFGLLGLVALAALRRSSAVSERSPLRVLLLAGLLMYLVTSLAFPVATLWGTFLHASGPLVVALIVVTALGADALVAAIGRRRRWSRPNAWLAVTALVALATPLALLQVTVVRAQSVELQQRLTVVAQLVAARPELAAAARLDDPPGPRAALVADHPMWLSDTLRRPVVALPDEPPADVWRLARDFRAPFLLILDERGRYPAALEAPGAARCFTRVALPPTERPIHLYQVADTCPTP